MYVYICMYVCMYEVKTCLFLSLFHYSTDNFIKHLSGELEAYALHAKRRKIDMSDVVLFMKRNKLLSENETFTSAANKYLCQEYVNEIVPVVDVINRETL